MSYRKQRHHRPKGMPRKEFIIWPYQDSDIVYSCGWCGTTKEYYYEKVKKSLPNLKLVYTIYDLAMLQDSLKHQYVSLNSIFTWYINWIAKNCDAIIYGGKTAQIDSEKYFAQSALPKPKGFPIKWGCDIKQIKNSNEKILEKLGIKKPFIMSVGSFDYKKNYKVLYQAYCIAKIKGMELPPLVVVGRLVWGNDLYSMFQRNPLTKNKIKIVSVNDEELNALYKNCLFTVLPTLYEGWSLTLPESFYFGKMCICSDVAPLREVGEKFAHYLNPHHPAEWAECIADFYTHPKKVKDFEQKIKKSWKPILWKETAENLYNDLIQVAKQEVKKDNKPVEKEKYNTKEKSDCNIYYDLSLIHYTLTGIPRSQMYLARNLYSIRKDIEFFYMNKGEYYRIPVSQLQNLLSNLPIDEAVSKDKYTIQGIKSDTLPFKRGNIVLSVGVGYDNKSKEALLAARKKTDFKIISSIYDFTPITVPHTHPEDRVAYYPIFLKNLYDLSDFIIYGGKTAQSDGETFLKEQGYEIKPSMAIKWGSDLVTRKYSKKETDDILKRCGVTGDYILTVGTIEARKNQQILYDAYLELMQDKDMKNHLPQLFICGHSGWKTDDFQRLLRQDERIQGKVIMFSPSDEELDVLYQNCKFTCLASLYEGWSLTLPESLNYGKFCLATDTPSLKETGEDIIDYANPYDPVEWAEKIKYYLTDKSALKNREALIKKKWHNTTWYDCAENINQFIDSLK